MLLITIMCLVIIKTTYQMHPNLILKLRTLKNCSKKKNKGKIHLKRDIVLSHQNLNQLSNKTKILNYQLNHLKIIRVCHLKILWICWIKFNSLKMIKIEPKAPLLHLLTLTLNNYCNNIKKHFQMDKLEPKVMTKPKK